MKVIVIHDGRLSMMETSDSRYASAKHVAGVSGLGKAEKVSGRMFKARRAKTDKGDYLVFHDWSAMEG